MRDKENNITPIKSGVSVDAVADIKATMSKWRDSCILLAEYRKIGYDAYISQGFTPEQALELCK